MGRDFDVEPPSIREAASTWRREEPRLGAAVERLRSTLNGLGQPWGDDEPGRAFAGRYEPSARELLTVIERLAGGLGSVAAGLDAMAGRYERAEEASRADRP